MSAGYSLMGVLATLCALLVMLQAQAEAQRAPSQAATNFCRSSKGKSGAVFAHEEFCDYYYECDPATDEPVLQACPNGLAFAGKGRGLTGACDYPHRVSCPDGTRTIGRKLTQLDQLVKFKNKYIY